MVTVVVFTCDKFPSFIECSRTLLFKPGFGLSRVKIILWGKSQERWTYWFIFIIDLVVICNTNHATMNVTVKRKWKMIWNIHIFKIIRDYLDYFFIFVRLLKFCCWLFIMCTLPSKKQEKKLLVQEPSSWGKGKEAWNHSMKILIGNLYSWDAAELVSNELEEPTVRLIWAK